MKTIICTTMAVVLGLSGLSSAASPKEAVVRIIRDDAIAAASQGELPASYTGCIISKEGYIVTSGECLHDNEEVKDTRFRVYLPTYSPDGRVSDVRAYTGASVAKENGLLLIRIQNAYSNMPYVRLASSDISKNDAEATYIGYHRELNLNTTEKEAADAIKSVGEQIMNGLAAGEARAYFNVYMTPDIPHAVGATPNTSTGVPTELRIGFGSNTLPSSCEGAPIISKNGNGTLEGVYISGPTAKPVSQVLRLAANNNVPVITDAFDLRSFLQEYGIIIIAACGGLLVLLVLCLVLMKGGKKQALPADDEKPTVAVDSKVVITLVGQDGTRHALTLGQLKHGVSIGRSSTCDVRFTADDISRHHATLQARTDGRLFVVDHSSRGTYVNDKKLTAGEPYKLHTNDTLRLASYTVKLVLG